MASINVSCAGRMEASSRDAITRIAITLHVMGTRN